MALGDVALGDREEARDARLGGEEVVERLVADRAVLGHGAAARHEQAASRVVERREVHPVGEREGAPRQVFRAPVARRGRQLPQAVREDEEAGREIAAVHRRDVARLERLERPRVVPVEDVPLPPFEALDGAQRLLDPREEALGVQPAEVVGREVREEGEADVRGRGARRDDGVSAARAQGGVVGREAVLVALHGLLEIAPRLPRRLQEELAIRAAEGARRGGRGVAEPPREERAQDPEGEKRRRERERSRAGRRDDDAGQNGRERARRHLEVERARAARHEAGGARRAGGRGFPLEEAAARHGDAHERQDDRVDGLVRVMGEEREADDRLRERDLELLPELAHEREQRLLRARPSEEEPGDGDEREGEDAEREEDPGPRGTRQDAEARNDEREERRRQEAAPEVVEDLPLGRSAGAGSVRDRPASGRPAGAT